MGIKNFLKDYSEETNLTLNYLDGLFANNKRKLLLIALILFSTAYSFFYFRLGLLEENTWLRIISLVCSITMIYFIPAFIGGFIKEFDKKLSSKETGMFLSMKSKLDLEFNKLNVELENFEFFDSEKKRFNYREYNLTPLLCYQFLLVYFQDNYDLYGVKRSKIYTLFNNSFDIGNQKMTSKNWPYFNDNYLLNREEHPFYKDLKKLMKKSY